MTKLIEKTGNIFDTKADAIGHGVNTRGVMGAGIAKQFREKYPQMHEAYLKLCSWGNEGTLQPGGCFAWDGEPQFRIYNLASQRDPGSDATYGWLVRSVELALRSAVASGLSTLALPQIGCGIGGLEWSIVKELLATMAKTTSVDIEAWTYAP